MASPEPLLPMAADVDRVFSVPKTTLSERDGSKAMNSGFESHLPSRSESIGSAASGRYREEGVELTGSAPAAVYFEANYRHITGVWETREVPSLVVVATFPTEESAQAYALALNQWIDQRPTPDVIQPFFVSDVRVEPSWEGLAALLDRMLGPETRPVG
jgi:hypothetical protein